MTYKLFYIILFNLIFSVTGLCQESNYVAYSEVQQRINKYVDTNSLEAIHLADSLLIYSSTGAQEIEAYIISATTYEKCGNYGKAIEASLRALELAGKAHDKISKSNICLMIARQFRNFGYKVQGQFYLQNAANTIHRIHDEKQRHNLIGKLYLEKGLFFMEDQNYAEANRNFELSRSIFYDNKLNAAAQENCLAKVEYQLGLCSFNQNLDTKALKHYQRSLDYLSQIKLGTTVLYAYVYSGLGNIYIKKGDSIRSEFFFQKALKASNKANCNVMKKVVYGDVMAFYKLKKNRDSLALYSDKYIGILTKINKGQKDIIKLNIWNIKKKDSYIFMSALPYLAFALLGVLLTFSILYKKKSKVKEPTTQKEVPADKIPALQINLSKETELKILSRIKDFEREFKYLDKNMTLPMLGIQLDTNEKYVRHILKKFKNKDYSDYINELRIFYIKSKLDTDDKYLKYKISYLAEEAGFSSHSKFSKTFKEVTSYTPSNYIALT